MRGDHFCARHLLVQSNSLYHCPSPPRGLRGRVLTRQRYLFARDVSAQDLFIFYTLCDCTVQYHLEDSGGKICPRESSICLLERVPDVTRHNNK